MFEYLFQNGLYSALPYVAFWAMINIAGWMADFFRERRFMNTTMTRKIFDSFGKLINVKIMKFCEVSLKENS